MDEGSKTYASANISVLDEEEPSVIGGVFSGSILEDAAASLTVSGTLTVDDPDADDVDALIVQEGTAGTAGIGTFALTAEGEWTYTADNSQSIIQGLAEGEIISDSFTAESHDGVSQIVTVTITGTMMLGSFQSVCSKLNRNNNAVLTASGVLTINDTDTGQAVFVEQLSTTGTAGIGLFSLQTDGSWTYSADNTQGAVQALGAN